MVRVSQVPPGSLQYAPYVSGGTPGGVDTRRHYSPRRKNAEGNSSPQTTSSRQSNSFGSTLFKWLPLVLSCFFLFRHSSHFNNEISRVDGNTKTVDENIKGLAKRLKESIREKDSSSGISSQASNPSKEAEFEFTEPKENEFLPVELPKDLKKIMAQNLKLLQNPAEFEEKELYPNSILLYGPPGTGKTSVARYLAAKAGTKICVASAAGFDNKYVGVGPQSVMKLYSEATRIAKEEEKPVIVLIDEIDTIGGKRDGDKDVHRDTLTQLLIELNKSAKNGVLTIGTTNRIERIDDALIRSGRLQAFELSYPSFLSMVNATRFRLDSKNPSLYENFEVPKDEKIVF